MHITPSPHHPITPLAHQHISTFAHLHITPLAHQHISTLAHRPITSRIPLIIAPHIHTPLIQPPENSVEILGERFILHPLKLIYWERKGMLICSDIHVGKGEHFRRNGIAVPRLLNKSNFWNLSGAFERFKPTSFLVLGDMVHSTENSEWKDFWDFLDNYPDMRRILVRGNHELYEDEVYRNTGFDVVQELMDSGIIFTHEPLAEVGEGFYNLSGHIHPAINLVGPARQNLKMACFWFGPNQGVLPAFGEFTGTHTIRPKRGDQVFVISENKVIELVK